LQKTTVVSGNLQAGQSCALDEYVKGFGFVNVKTADLKQLDWWKIYWDGLEQCFLTFLGFVRPCHRLLHSHSPQCECMSHVTIINLPLHIQCC